MNLTSAARIARTSLLLADGLLLALFLTGAAAAYLDPAVYWFGAMIAVTLPLLGIFLLPLAILLWRIRRRFLALVQVALVLAMGSRHISLERFAQRAPSPSDLVLMTLNAPRRPDSKRLGTELAQLVGELKPDMIALQESKIWIYLEEPDRLRAWPKFAPLLESLDYAMLIPQVGPPGENWREWSQPLLARFEIEQQDQLSFRSAKPDWPELRVLRTEFRWQQRKIAHYNVHLASFGPTKPWIEGAGWLDLGTWLTHTVEVRRAYRIRSWQVEQVRELIDHERHPVILSGDFNSTPDSWVYHRLSQGLQDAYRVAGSGWGATYHSNAPTLRIDFVLLGPEFEAVSAQVRSLSTRFSDHRPLTARFRWRQ